MLTVTLVLLGCLVGAMATWGPYMNGNYMKRSMNWGASSSHKPYMNYPNYPTSSSYKPYMNYPMASNSYDMWYGKHDSNPMYYNMNPKSMYSDDMYSSWSGPKYNWKPAMKHTTSWKPTTYYKKMSYGYPMQSWNKMSSWHPTGPWKSSMGNAHVVNIGGTSKVHGVTYGLNQRTYKPPMSKQHQVW